MRILIDECLDWRLERALEGLDSAAVSKMGWSGIKNGQLLALAVENGFDVFLTADRNLAFQQNIPKLRLGVIVLEARGVRLQDTLPLMPKVLLILGEIKPGEIRRVSST